MGHADGLGPLGLARVNGDDAAPDGLGHVSAGVDGHHDHGRQPDVGEFHRVIRKIGQAVVDEHRLEHHGGAPEYLHIHPDNDAHQLQYDPLGQGVPLGVGDGVQHAADKADDAANHRAHQGQHQGVAHAGEVGATVFAPELEDIGKELGKLIHWVLLLFNTARREDCASSRLG